MLTMTAVWSTDDVPALLAPLNWQRYLLLPETFSMLLVAIGFDWVARRTARALRRIGASKWVVGLES